MSESAGKTRHGAEKTAKAAGATAGGRGGGTARPEHPRAAFPRRLRGVLGGRSAWCGGTRPGAILAGAPGEPVAPRMRRHGYAGERGQAALPPLREPAGGGSAHRGDRGRGPGGRLHAAPRLHHGLHAGRRGVSRRRHGRAGCGMCRALGRALSGAVGPSHELSPCPRPAASSRRRPGKCLRRAACFSASALDGGAPIDERGDHWACEREAVATRQISFGEFLRERGLVLRSDLMRLRSHWVTPESEARRYDTHFFLARLPKGQHADGRTSEAVEAAWIAPGEALARFDAGPAQARASRPSPTSLPSWRRPRWTRRGTLPSTGTCGRIRWRDRAARWCSAAR